MTEDGEFYTGAEDLEDFEVTELDDKDLEDVAGGQEVVGVGLEPGSGNSNCGCNGNPNSPPSGDNNTNCAC
jgi:hypothetical protein